ncbi:hypothetical protein BJX62DRAFT_243036 [Aspergillus germanicus]
MEVILRMCPEIEVDDPVDDDREKGNCGSTSPIAVAVACKFSPGLYVLLDFGRKSSKLIIGQGLVAAAQKEDLDAMSTILEGFQLSDRIDGTSSVYQHYSAFIAAAKRAALKQDIRPVQLLAEHVPTLALKEKFLGQFLIHAISGEQWYECLLEIRALVDLHSYERLAGKALTGLAAERESARQPHELAGARAVLWRELQRIELQRISEVSSTFPEAYQDAFHEVSKCGNIEMARVLLGDEDSQWTLRVPEHSVPDINQPDGEGKSPLYHAGVNGYLELFQLLVENGADILTRHTPVQLLADGRAEPRKDSINILQVTLDARLASEYHDHISGIWCHPLRDSWGPVVMHLLEAGLEVHMDNPALTKFFHIACCQGEISYVENLLARGISLTCPTPIGTGGDLMFGSAIHAAAFGGQKAIVQCLVLHGGDVRARADCDIFQGVKPQTPIIAALEFRTFPPPTSEAAVLETCLYLVDAGASEEDAEALLDRACKDGNVDVVESLLRRGTKVEKVPSTQSSEVYQVLTEAGYRFPSGHESIAELQRLALEHGDLTFLRTLLDEHGLQIRDVLWAVLRSKARADAIIVLLMEKCSLDINGVRRAPHQVDSTKVVPETFLIQAACTWHDPELVDVLLKRGANPYSPGLPLIPLVAFLQRVSSGVNNWWDAETDLRITRLLLDYGADPNGAREEDWNPTGTSGRMIQRTPLLLAVSWKVPEAVELAKHLIDKGADVNFGRISPLHISNSYKRDAIADVLCQNGAKDKGDPSYLTKDFTGELRREVHQDLWGHTRIFSDDEDSDS